MKKIIVQQDYDGKSGQPFQSETDAWQERKASAQMSGDSGVRNTGLSHGRIKRCC